LSTFDEGWYRDVTEFAQHTRWLNGTMSALTVLLIVALALMVCYAGWHAWRHADHLRITAVMWTALACGISLGGGLALKQVFHEARPCLTVANVTTVQACPGPTDYSFPSDHTTIAATLAAGLWLINRRLGAIGAALALLEGFSRVYLGQHYPHDVLAAYLLSGLIVFGGWRLLRGPLLLLESRLPSRARPVQSSDSANDSADASAPPMTSGETRPQSTAPSTSTVGGNADTDGGADTDGSIGRSASVDCAA
jgi:membrane-associated phospholipid phosphatase